MESVQLVSISLMLTVVAIGMKGEVSRWICSTIQNEALQVASNSLDHYITWSVTLGGVTSLAQPSILSDDFSLDNADQL